MVGGEWRVVGVGVEKSVRAVATAVERWCGGDVWTAGTPCTHHVEAHVGVHEVDAAQAVGEVGPHLHTPGPRAKGQGGRRI